MKKKRGLATLWWEKLSNQRGLLCKSDYIKHRAGKALIKVNKETPKAPAALSSTLWPESNLLTAEICCTKDASQLRNKVTTAFTALLGIWFLIRLLGEKNQTNRKLAVLAAEKPSLLSPVSFKNTYFKPWITFLHELWWTEHHGCKKQVTFRKSGSILCASYRRSTVNIKNWMEKNTAFHGSCVKPTLMTSVLHIFTYLSHTYLMNHSKIFKKRSLYTYRVGLVSPVKNTFHCGQCGFAPVERGNWRHCAS